MSSALVVYAADLTTRGTQDVLPFSCETFAPNLSEADLRLRYGAEHVKTAPVPWGGSEGDYTEGTVIFATDAAAKVEILWSDRIAKRKPEWVSVQGDRSRWRTHGGITLGTTLREIERANGRPFRLLGFGTDVSGTVMSWSGGRLSAHESRQCRVRLRLNADWDRIKDGQSPAFRGLSGEREFSSGHPSMQSLNPAVYEMFLQYR